MKLRNCLVLATGGALAAGAAALASDPVPMPNGITLTPTPVSAVDPISNPMGCDAFYETFDATFEPNYGTGWTVSDGFVGCWGPAHRFTADNDYALCEILISATHVTGNNQYMFRLHADDAGGSVPGTVLGSWDVTGLPQNQAGPTPLIECDATGISLDNGSNYWLSMIASSGAGNSWGVLRQSTDPAYSSITGANWACTQWNPMNPRNAGAWRVTGNVGGGGPTIRLSGDCPGRITIAWSNVTPNRTMGILFASNTGNFTLPGGACGGTTLGLSSSGLRLVNTVSSGSGSGQVSGSAGTGACRGYLQLVIADGSPCSTTNVVQIP